MKRARASTPAGKRGAMRRLLGALTAGHERAMALGLLLACATALMGALLLGVSGWFITATAIAGLAVGTALAFDIFLPSASIRLLALGRTGGRYAERVLTHAAALHALVGLRERLFRGLARPAASTRARQRRQWRLQPARLLLRLTWDLNAAEALYLRLLTPACAALAASLGLSAWLAWHHWGLGLAGLLWLLGAGLGVPWWLLRASARLTLAQSRHGERLRQHALDLAGGQAELVMAGRFDAQLARWLEQEAALARLEDRLQRCDALAAAAWQMLHTLTLAAAVAAAGWLVLARDMAVPTAAFFVLMAIAAMEPFAALRRGAAEWAGTALAARRLQAPLQQAAAPAPAALPLPAPGLAACLDAVRMQGWGGMEAGAEGDAAPGCSLQVAVGERLALIGPSGSGKSTLLQYLGGELAPSHGSVQARPSVGLPQQTALFGDSVRANVDLQQRGLPDAAVWAALQAAGLQEAIAARPEGLDAMLGEGGLGLSRGQARRLALARLFVCESDFWLLDEPTDGLDADTAADVLARLDAALQGKTAVIATHLRREAALADRLVLLEHGRIAAQAVRGTPAFTRLLEGLRDD
ncbi:MAG: ATP-binding cassette domain-containing protein [Comamonadaceae bacterium]|nr:ATP-binding cassette domain-containing protein [Comamonadaceae bacterium]